MNDFEKQQVQRMDAQIKAGHFCINRLMDEATEKAAEIAALKAENARLKERIEAAVKNLHANLPIPDRYTLEISKHSLMILDKDIPHLVVGHIYIPAADEDKGANHESVRGVRRICDRLNSQNRGLAGFQRRFNKLIGRLAQNSTPPKPTGEEKADG